MTSKKESIKVKSDGLTITIPVILNQGTELPENIQNLQTLSQVVNLCGFHQKELSPSCINPKNSDGDCQLDVNCGVYIDLRG